jgi:hypothetical protein
MLGKSVFWRPGFELAISVNNPEELPLDPSFSIEIITDI